MGVGSGAVEADSDGRVSVAGIPGAENTATVDWASMESILSHCDDAETEKSGVRFGAGLVVICLAWLCSCTTVGETLIRSSKEG